MSVLAISCVTQLLNSILFLGGLFSYVSLLHLPNGLLVCIVFDLENNTKFYQANVTPVRVCCLYNPPPLSPLKNFKC